MLGLDVDRERRKSTIIRRAQLIFRDIHARRYQVLANLLGRLDFRVERVDDADEGDLFDALGVFADRLANLLVHLFFILLGCALDEKVAGVHLEHGGEQFVVVDVEGVNGVAVAAGTGVDADVLAFLRGEAVEDSKDLLSVFAGQGSA